MKEYLFLFRGGDGATLRQSPEKWQQHMERWMLWMGEMTQQGKFVGAQPLDTSGRLVTGNRKVVSDGQFAEGKEMVGGYLICKADTYDSAVNLAKGCPILEFEDGQVEVREIQELKM
jgi:hypothetical protein